MSSTSEEEKPKRAPRKRAVKKTTATPRKRTVKSTAKKTTRKVSKPNESGVESSAFETPDTTAHSTEQVRKAPTAFATERSSKKRKQRQGLIVVGLILIGVVASAGLGYTDPGVIDVDATIEARNQRLKNNSATANDTERTSQTIAIQNRGDNSKPDGGLVGRGIGTQAPPPNPATTTATTTASTTDGTASSTDAVIDETASSTDATREESETE